MQHYINYTVQGRILGFTKGDIGLNIEVPNAIWFEAQSYNKIIINGENISFDKIDWRTPKEIEIQRIQARIKESKQYLASTSWYVERLNDPSSGKLIPEHVIVKRAEARELINTLEYELEEGEVTL